MAPAQTNEEDIIFLFISSVRNDHGSGRCRGTQNQQTRVRPSHTHCRLPCRTTPGPWRLQCLPVQPIRRRQTASFSPEMIRPPIAVLPYLLHCIGWMRFDYGWHVIRWAATGKGINITMVLLFFYWSYLKQYDFMINKNAGRKAGGSWSPKIYHTTIKWSGIEYATI